jgi:Sugar (and other) transporter
VFSVFLCRSNEPDQHHTSKFSCWGGTTGMAVGMIVVALTFAIGGSHLRGAAACIAIAGLLVYTGSFAIGLGPVFWLLISGIYPVKIRGQVMGVATMANRGANSS